MNYVHVRCVDGIVAVPYQWIVTKQGVLPIEPLYNGNVQVGWFSRDEMAFILLIPNSFVVR